MPSGIVLSRWAVLMAVATAASACGGDEPAVESAEDAEIAVAPATPPIAVAPADTAGTAAGGAAPAGAAPTPGAQAAAPAAGGLPAGVTQAMVQQGQQIFSGPGICFSCHGPNGQGGPLAPNLTDNQWLWVQPGPGLYDDLVTLIRTGVSQPKEHPAPMPAMGTNLSDEQLRAVAAYVYSLSQG